MRLWKGKIKMLWAILSTLLVGAVAGWLASKIMGGGKGRGAGLGSVLKKLFTTPTFLVYVAMVALSLLH